jgi:hypothetical protein
MPFWQLDPAFFHEKIEELICLGYIKIIGAFSLLDPPLITVNGSVEGEIPST